MLAPSIDKIKKMTDSELEAAYDQLAANTQIGTAFLMDEIRDRRLTRVAQNTLWIAVFAAVTAFLTLGITILMWAQQL